MTTMQLSQGEFADVHGSPQWLTIRGKAANNPALLVIGGPGFGYAALAPFFADWERELTLVQWDQPGAGFTFGKTAEEPRTIERLVADGLRAAEIASALLDSRKLGLLCISAGTIVGLHMAQRRPELFSAYVGSGQVVDWARQDASSYRLLLDRARAREDAVMRAELEAIGPPPYPDTATDALKSKYAGAPTPREAAAFAELMPLFAAALQGRPAGASYLARGVQWPEPRARSFAAYSALRHDIVGFDARCLSREFGLPMFFAQGADDVFTVTAEVERYAGEITAPHVEFVTIDGAGHSASLLRHEILALLRERVRPELLKA